MKPSEATDVWDSMRSDLLLLADIDRGVRVDDASLTQTFLRQLREATGLVAVGEGHRAEVDRWDYAVSFFDAMVACERGEAIDDTGMGRRRMFADVFEHASGIRLAFDYQ